MEPMQQGAQLHRRQRLQSADHQGFQDHVYDAQGKHENR
jgi:hypothetical protein